MCVCTCHDVVSNFYLQEVLQLSSGHEIPGNHPVDGSPHQILLAAAGGQYQEMVQVRRGHEVTYTQARMIELLRAVSGDGAWSDDTPVTAIFAEAELGMTQFGRL